MTSTKDFQHDLEGVSNMLRQLTVVVHSGAPRAARRRGRPSSGEGSGIVWSTDGTVVTNAHVAVAGAARVTLADGRTAHAQVVARHPRTDLALLQVDIAVMGGAPWPAPALGEPSALRVGELVVALGHPLGIEHSLAMGVVHAAPDARRSPYLVADIRLAPGNSGGPLADARGRIVGVNSMIVGGLGVAVSIDAVRRMIVGNTPRPRLGVELRPVRVRIPAGSAETSVALLVLTVDPVGAAAGGGILQGDLLLGHAGRPFTSPDELTRLLREAGPGGILRLDVGRGGKQMGCAVELRDARAGVRQAA